MDDPRLGLQSLIACAYDAAADPTRWSTFTAEAGSFFRSPCAGMFTHDFSNGSVPDAAEDSWLFQMTGLDTHWLGAYLQHFSQVNPWLRDPARLPIARTVTSEMLYPEESLLKSEFFADWLRPQDLFHSMGGLIGLRTPRVLSMTFLRSKSLRRYSVAERSYWQILMPHVQRAVELHSRLVRAEARAAELNATLMMLPTGVLTLDRVLCVRTMNVAAETMLNGAFGLRLNRSRRIEAPNLDADRRLQSELRSIVDPFGAAARALTVHRLLRFRGPRGTLCARATGLPGRAALGSTEPVVAVFLAPGEVQSTDLAQVLQSYYRMPRAEALLTSALSTGMTLRQFADQRGLSINTVRTQLRHAAARVGVKRQGDLIRAVLTGPAFATRALAKPPEM